MVGRIVWVQRNAFKLVGGLEGTMAEKESEVKATHRLDVLGFYCPVPVVKTRQTLHKLTNGDVLEVLADDPETLHDMPLLLNRSQHQLLGIVNENGEIRFTIEVIK